MTAELPDIYASRQGRAPGTMLESYDTDGREQLPRHKTSNAQYLWIGSGRARRGRTFPNDPLMVSE